MRKIADLASKQLEWKQPAALKKWYELQAGDELVGTLRYRSLGGSFATGESADGCWTMKRTGFWRARITVRECDSETDMASFRDNTWKTGGTLSMADGRELRVTTSLWRSRLTFLDQQENELIGFEHGGLVHLSARVDIRPKAKPMAELPWMVMLGWYLTIAKQEDESAAAAVAAVS